MYMELLLPQAIKDVFIPLLVCQATPESSEALKFVAKMTNTVRKTMPHINQCRSLSCL